MKKTVKTWLLGVVSLAAVQLSATPVDFDFNGTFANDNDVVLIDFTLTGDSTITIFSSSWLAGNNGMGFDPILAIWDATGNLVHQQDDGGNVGSTMSNGVSYDHGSWDSYFVQFLTAGSYRASIAQYNNFANSNLLSGGFMYDANPNFTFDNGWGQQALFNGVYSGNDARTGDWAFHILGVDQATINVPEPTTLAVLGLGLLGFAGFRRK